MDIEEYKKQLEQMTGLDLFEEKERLKSIYKSQASNPEKWAEGQEVAKAYIEVQYKKAKAKFGNRATKQSLVGFYR